MERHVRFLHHTYGNVFPLESVLLLDTSSYK